MNRLLIFTLFLISSVTFAGEEKTLHPNFKKAFAHLKTKCQDGKTVFHLNLGDDVEEPDSESAEFGFRYFWIVPEPGEPIAAVPPKEYNELLFLFPVDPSLCEDTLALKQRDGTIAIFVRQNGRPFADHLGVVFYNPADHKVVASSRDAGMSSKVEGDPKGLFIRIQDEPSDLAQFQVKVRGHASTTKEEMFSFWSTLSRKKAQIQTQVNPERTWEKSNYRPYFKTRDEFEKAFGWNAKKQSYENLWVYRVSEPDCVHPSHTRAATSDAKRWFCLGAAAK